MKLLFELDKKDYDPKGSVFSRPSARAVIIKDGRVAMVRSLKYDYCKFPGGGIEKGESNIDALIRETAEETGLIVKSESIREYGLVRRIQKGKDADIFLQENFYYICDISEQTCPQRLDDYEAEEKFTLEFMLPQDAVNMNLNGNFDSFHGMMAMREAKVLQCLADDGFFA